VALYSTLCRARALDFRLQNFHLDFCCVLALRVKIGCRIRLAKMMGGRGRGARGRALWNGLVHQTSRHGLATPCCLQAPRSKVYPELPSIIDRTPAPPSFFAIILSILAPRLGQRWAVLTTQGPLSLFQARHLPVQSLFEGRRVDLLSPAWLYKTLGLKNGRLHLSDEPVLMGTVIWNETERP
jgi:hypothetical protein